MTTEIVFGEAETDVPASTKRLIAKYIGALQSIHNRFVDNFEDALGQFKTTVVLGSEDRAAKQVVQEVAMSAIEVSSGFLIGALGKSAPAIPVVISLWKGLSPSFKDGGRQGSDIGDWLHDLTEVMNGWRSAYNIGVIAELTEEVTLSILESSNPSDGFDDFVAALDAANRAVKRSPSIRELELGMYEAWINTNFSGFQEEGMGVIDIRLEAKSGRARLVSNTVQAPKGAKLARRLNRLVGSVRRFKSPSDLRVHKRIAICAEGIAGGRAWYFGWVDPTNKPVHEPIVDRARRVFRGGGWRAPRRYFEAENGFFDNPTSCADTDIHEHAD